MEQFNIWDSNNKTIRVAYEQCDNYECIETGANSEWCYIFFSSNGLYYPNTKEIFEEQILKKNRYEWKWVVKNSTIYQIAGKVIYVRDIYKKWYTNGINERENTIDKTVELLKQLTAGYKVVTVGSSAGGYMAVLTAVKLNAEYCFNFSGQYIISDTIGNSYFDLSEMVKLYNGNIFYFFPFYCEDDKRNYNSIKNNTCIRPFGFNTNRHAKTMLTGNMCYIIDKSEKDMLSLFEKYKGKRINRFEFLFRTVPISRIFEIVWKEVQGLLVRLRGKHWMGV